MPGRTYQTRPADIVSKNCLIIDRKGLLEIPDMVFEIIESAGFLVWAEMRDDLPVFFPVMFECLAGKYSRSRLTGWYGDMASCSIIGRKPPAFRIRNSTKVIIIFAFSRKKRDSQAHRDFTQRSGGPFNGKTDKLALLKRA